MSDTDVINPTEPYRMPDQGAVDAWRQSTPMPQPGGAPALAPQSPLSAMGPPPAPTAGPPPEGHINYPPKPQMGAQQAPPTPPDAKEYQKDAMAWASAFAVLGAVAGRFTRAPGGAALAAFGAAVKGWQTGNLQAYETATKQWEEQNKVALENNQRVIEDYKRTFENYKLNIDEQMQELQLKSANWHDKMMYDATASKNHTLAAQIYEKNVKFTAEGGEAAAALSGKRRKEEAQQALLGERLASGQINPDGPNPQTGQPYSEQEKMNFKYVKEQYLNGFYGQPEGAKGAGKPVGGMAGQLVAQENSERTARGESRMTAQEEISFIQQIHPPRSASAMSVEAFKKDFKAKQGRDPSGTEIQDFTARQAEVSSEARTKGTREANLDIILRVTDSAIPAALDASEKVPRGGWVPLNQIIQKGQVASSNPALMSFGMANLQLAEGWARAMNPTGVMRESDRDKALSFLSTATSKETYKVLVEQLRTQIQRERAAIQSGKQSAVSAPGEVSSVSESTGAGWTDLGGGVRIREKP